MSCVLRTLVPYGNKQCLCGIYLVIEIKYSQKAERLNSGHERSQSSKYIFCNETT